MYKKCIECPFHKVIDDPDIYDSWNADDEALVCTKIKRDPDPKSRYMVDRQPFQGSHSYQKLENLLNKKPQISLRFFFANTYLSGIPTYK